MFIYDAIPIINVNNKPVKKLWELYQSGMISIFEFNEAMNKITEIVRCHNICQEQASKARELKDQIPDYIRKALEDKQ